MKYAMDDKQLLEWATFLIKGQQEARSYSVVSIHLEGGRITRAKVDISEKPVPVDLTPR